MLAYDAIDSDNVYPHQYVKREGSDAPYMPEGEGTIYHADLDMAIVCEDKYDKRFCTADLALDANCRVLSSLANVTLDCAFPTPSKDRAAPVLPKNTDRMNTTHALQECVRSVQEKCQARKLKRQTRCGPYRSEQNISSKRNATSYVMPQGVRPRRKYLTCSEIAGLEMVRLVGEGKEKAVYEVTLPSGERAAAKRCLTGKCLSKRLIEKEAHKLRGLNERYGDEGSLQFFGGCYLDMEMAESGPEYRSTKERTESAIHKYKLNFSVGHTSVIESGHPLMESRKEPIDESCYASFLAAQDKEDLANIARRYANYFKSPLLLLPYRKHRKKNSPLGVQHQDGKAILRYENIETDNVHLHQYVTRRASSISAEKGTIHHADLDQVISCNRHYDAQFCTADLVLDANCRVLSRMANVHLNCSHPTTSEFNIAAVTSKKPHRISTTRALRKCTLQGEI